MTSPLYSIFFLFASVIISTCSAETVGKTSFYEQLPVKATSQTVNKQCTACLKKYPSAAHSRSEHLDEMIVNANGQLNYIDPWANWYISWKREFKESAPALKAKFAKDVEFVYLCYHSKEKLWKPAISECEIEGEHYFLKEQHEAAWNQQASISGYPTYAMVNKEGGMAYSTFGYSPSEAKTSEILAKLTAE